MPDALASITLLVAVDPAPASLSVRLRRGLRLVSGTRKACHTRARSRHLCTCLREIEHGQQLAGRKQESAQGASVVLCGQESLRNAYRLLISLAQPHIDDD